MRSGSPTAGSRLQSASLERDEPRLKGFLFALRVGEDLDLLHLDRCRDESHVVADVRAFRNGDGIGAGSIADRLGADSIRSSGNVGERVVALRIAQRGLRSELAADEDVRVRDRLSVVGVSNEAGEGGGPGPLDGEERERGGDRSEDSAIHARRTT